MRFFVSAARSITISIPLKIDESTFSSAYTEFVDFLRGKCSSLTTDLNDAISALQVFEEYVYDKKID